MENSPYLNLLIQNIIAQEGADLNAQHYPLHESMPQEEMAMLMMLKHRFNMMAQEERARQMREESAGIINHPESLLYQHLMEESQGNP